MSASRSSPRGRDAVKAALVRAATDLFAARGPGGVSVRDVAAKAGVNHGLVHRHFGSKEELLAQVLEQLRAGLQAELPANADGDVALLARDLLAVSRRHGAWWRILARALLDGEDPRRLQATFPVIDRLRNAIERAPASTLRGLDPRIVTAVVVATGLGLLLFAPFLRAAVGLGRDEWKRYEAALPAVLGELLRSRSA